MHRTRRFVPVKIFVQEDGGGKMQVKKNVGLCHADTAQ